MSFLAGFTLPAGLIGGVCLGRASGHLRWYVTRGAALGLVGPILYGLWRWYSWLVRLDPATGYVGLHKPSVLFLNVIAFAAVGIILGMAYGRILRRGGESGEER